MARVDDLRTALKAQSGPLAHVKSAHDEAWTLVHSRSLANEGATPPGAWRAVRGFLEGSRPLLKRHQETLDQHDVGLTRAAKLEGEQQVGYLAKMSEHFSHRVRELGQFKEELLDVSETVGSDRSEPELQRVDTLFTLMGYAAGDLARQASEYQQGLESPGRRQDRAEQDLVGDLIAAPALAGAATVDTVGDIGEGLVWGETTRPVELDPARHSGLRVAEPAMAGALTGPEPQGDLVAYYRENYGVDMRFEPDGKPLLEPIGDLRLLTPLRGPGHELEPSPSLGHGERSY